MSVRAPTSRPVRRTRARRAARRGPARESGRGWQRRTSRSTAPSRSPSSRGWRRSASGPACTSGRPANAVCTTWCGRSSTTPSTRRWPVTATRIDVVLLADGGVRVIDNGRGFPVDLHPKLKKPGVEVALTVLHAGGKFDGKAYAVSGGLHGVGVSVVNALSTRMAVEIHKSGFVWRQKYVYSKPEPLEKGEATDHTGSTVDVLARPGDLRDGRVRLPDHLPPPAGDGLPQPRPHHPPARRAGRRGRGRPDPRGHLLLQGRHRRLRPAPQRLQEPDAQDGGRVRGRGRGHVGRDRHAVERVVRRVGLHLRQHDQHPRGRHPRGGLPGRADQRGQPVRRGQEAAQGRRASSPARTSARGWPRSSRSS